MRLGVVLLCAGKSSRMGSPKMLLPWGSTSIVGHLMRTWRELGAVQVAVVCAAGDSALSAELDQLRVSKHVRILNPQPERGMFSSVQCAARWSGWQNGLTDWVIALGDQPHLKLGTLRELLAFRLTHPNTICQPAFGGAPKHPVLLPRRAFEELRQTSCAMLKDYLAQTSIPKAVCELTDAGLAMDLDTPADYQNALQLFLRNS